MIKKIIKSILIVLVGAFIIGQFIRPNHVNTPVAEAETLGASTAVPPQVDAILKRSCADCHSNETSYPWYSQITPVNWFLDNHIQEGRRELNMSVWNTYPVKKKGRKLDEICDQVEKGEMPLPSYLWIHWDAGLKPGDAQLLCDWARSEKAKLPPE
jgi:hypothetical protein